MFKSCTALHIINPDTLAMFRSQEFEEIASNNLSEPPHKTQWRRYGFHVPDIFGEQTIYTGALGVRLFYICKQERVLPGAVINKHLDQRIAEFNDKNNRPPMRKEVAEMKDDVVNKLLPDAFIRPSYVKVMVTKNWLLIDNGSSKVVEDLLSYLRDILSEADEIEHIAQYRHVNVTNLPNLEAPSWLRQIAFTPYITYQEGDKVPEDAPKFRHLDSVVLKSKSKGGVVRFKGIDFSEAEVDAALESGKSIVELAVEWGDDPGRTELSCVISDKLVIKQLKFAELNLQEVPEEDKANAPAIHFDATVAIISDILVKFVDQIYEANKSTDEEDDVLKKLSDLGNEFTKALTGAGGRIVTDSLDLDGEEPDPITYGTEVDPLYVEAVFHVQTHGKASISNLQRHLRVGFNRAARFLETMEEKSIVSAPNESGVRTVFEDDEI